VRDPLRHVGSWWHDTATVSEGTELGRHARIGARSEVTRAIVEGTIGADCKVWRFAHIYPGGSIGHGCMIAQNVLVAGTLGNNVRVQNNTNISKKVVIEDDVYIGAGVQFCNSVHPSAVIEDELVPITVKKGASIGCNVCLIGEITIGEGAVVGAGCVVTCDVPPNAVVYGLPARQRGEAKSA